MRFGRERGRLLVARVDDAHPAPVHAVVDREDVPAGQREQAVDAVRLQRFCDEVAAVSLDALAHDEPNGARRRAAGQAGSSLGGGGAEQFRPVGALEREVQIDQVVDRERRAVVGFMELGGEVPVRRRHTDRRQQRDDAAVGRRLHDDGLAAGAVEVVDGRLGGGADAQLQILSVPTERIGYLFVNALWGPTKDVRVRRAIAHAIDRGLIIEALLGGYGRPVDIMLTPANFGYALWKLKISQIAPILPYVFLVLMLVFRPKGLLGTREG